MSLRLRWAKKEDHWSCIAHLSAEDLLKSTVIEEKKFKYSPWAGADTPLWPKFWCQQEGLVTMVICSKFQKNHFNLWLYTHLFMIQLQVRGRQQKPLVTLVICYKFKKNLFEVWFYTIFFMILYMYITPGQGLTTPWGRNFDVNRNILSFRSFPASLKKKSLWCMILYIFFHDLIHVCI